MPIWADPARGETVRLLADDDMTLLATFVAPASPRPTASDLRMIEGADPERFARVAARDLPGVRIVTRIDEAAALAEVGSVVVSTAVHLVRAGLQSDEPPLSWAAPRLPAGASIGGVDDTSAAVAAFLAEFGRHDPGEARTVLAGDLLGPVHDDATAVVTGPDGRITAAVVVTRWEGIGEEWLGGPWVAALARRPAPAPPLVGRGLLARAVAVAALEGHDAIGITLDASDHRCERLARRLGFTPRFHRVSLDLPGEWPAQ